ncbi:hypothetical protein C8J56DRAFT_315889 [Mycena floridula]|nr:hypothetical protein C8J56DRAFT_315889 [Mycena floridula]
MSMEFETLGRNPSFLDMDNASSYMLDNGIDSFLHYPASPAGFSNAIGLDFQSLTDPSYGSGNYTTSGAYTTSSAIQHPYSPPTAETPSISPQMVNYPLSGGDLSSDESRSASGRRSRGANQTPPPARSSHSVRYNPLGSPAIRSSARNARRRRNSRSSPDHDSDDAEEEEEFHPSSGGVDPRREAVRKQRIESEQRRRDELRDGYARLKAVLPQSSSKSSKVSLLDRAAHHLKHLDTCKTQAEQRLKAMEAELVRVRSLNEVLSLRAVQQREAALAASGMNGQSYN